MTVLNRRRFLASSAALGALPFLPSARAAAPQLAGPFFNRFAMSLYGELRKETGNVFCSPYSISTALGMTAAGAKNNTLAQMRKVLSLGDDPAASDAAYEEMARKINEPSKAFELATANALWAQPGYPWNPDYLKQVTKVFRAGIEATDFKTDPEASRKTINAWVEKQTKEKIKDLMPDGSINRMTRLVLTNAIYFKGSWEKAFEKKVTRDAPFTMANGTKKTVPLMFREATIDYGETEHAKIVRLPYKGGELSMIAALPKNPAKFDELESKLESSLLNLDGKTLNPTRDLMLWLPKFKVETKYTLNDPLKTLGMTDAFDNAKADFGAMTTTPSELYISIVVHKAFIDVNEEGTEAAAATGVGMKTMSAPAAEPKQFRADRPFFFALRHEATNTVLFLGRYINPA